KACVLPENPASYRVVRTKSYLFNKAIKNSKLLAGARFYQKINTGKFPLTYAHNQSTKNVFVSGSKVLKL
ncbi:hypothetical protein MZD94_16770, partial [Escherichia coli]|nr:hypothetical protein [Escherichia coli]MCK2386454.1 hypothetical protein [Escherichia coli]